MPTSTSPLAIAIFAAFVLVTLALSFYLGARAKSAAGYFAAGGGIHWFVNGIAFAGDYLSAASFLGICGMIAFYGYDGFLYSIGYLAGWIVALFVIAEPLKRMGRFTFADALDSRFNSRGIKLSVAISTLVVSIFYLIPQMVGAGVLVKPLLGFSHSTGVIIVGAVVILIVVTAGMVSTTYVQFLKGSLLVVFSTVLTFLIINRGLAPDGNGAVKEDSPGRRLAFAGGIDGATFAEFLTSNQYEIVEPTGAWEGKPYLRLRHSPSGVVDVFRRIESPADGSGTLALACTQAVTKSADGKTSTVAVSLESKDKPQQVKPIGHFNPLPVNRSQSGPLGPIHFLQTVQQSEVILWGSDTIKETDGSTTTVYYPKPTKGSDVLRPGNHPTFKGIRSEKPVDKECGSGAVA